MGANLYRSESRHGESQEAFALLAKWRWTFSTLLAITTSEYFHFLSEASSVGYIIALVVITIAIAQDGRQRDASAATKWSGRECLGFIFALYILVIYLLAWFSEGRPTDSFILVLGSSVLLIAPIAYRLMPIYSTAHSQDTRPIRALALASTAFGVAGLLDVYRAPVGEPPSFFNHETVFLAVLVLCFPRERYFYPGKLVVSGAVILSFFHYPSATTALALSAAAALFLFLRSYRGKRRVGWILAFFLVCAPVFVMPNGLLEAFYGRVGRVNNSGTRELLWSQALRTLEKEPVLGSSGRDPITGLAMVRGALQPVPFHNSYLTLAVYGGIVAAALLVCLISICLIQGTRTNLRLVEAGAAIWVPALAGVSLGMLVNPILDNPASALPFYLLLVISTHHVNYQEKVTKGSCASQSCLHRT